MNLVTLIFLRNFKFVRLENPLKYTENSKTYEHSHKNSSFKCLKLIFFYIFICYIYFYIRFEENF